MTTQQKSDYISNQRVAANEFLAAVQKLNGLESQRIALDANNMLTEEDFVGANEGLSKTDLDSLATTVGAITALMGQGHATNLYKLK